MVSVEGAKDSLGIYLAQVRRQPLLTAEQEDCLARRWREEGDRRAADKLIAAHLRMVVRMAVKLKGYGLQLQDLIAEGNVGLMRALESYDPERGHRFATYATWWVRAAMFEYVLRFSTPVKFGLSAERKRLFFNLRSAKARVTQGGATIDDAKMAEIAKELGVGAGMLRDMDQLMSSPGRSLDETVSAEDDTTLLERLADDKPDAEEVLSEREELHIRRRQLADAWTCLSQRERDIVTERKLREQPQRLEDLAQRYNISRERVRQIESAAMAKLSRVMTSEHVAA
jgi:RNA polymerase sigma-32 factor